MGIVKEENYKQIKFLIKNEKQQIEPKIILNEKINGEWKNTVCERGYEGKFISLNKWSYEDKEGKIVPGFELVLFDDEDGEVKFRSSWTNPSMFFVNSLLGYTGQTINKIKITCSAKEYNGKVMASLRCNIDGQPGTQLVSKEEKVNYVTPIKDPDTNEIIKMKYNKLQELFESKYDLVNAKAIKQENKVIETESIFGDNLRSKAEVLGDDLPF